MIFLAAYPPSAILFYLNCRMFIYSILADIPEIFLTTPNLRISPYRISRMSFRSTLHEDVSFDSRDPDFEVLTHLEKGATGQIQYISFLQRPPSPSAPGS
jgi:hypothetical protein